jgi:maleamate amidohydrolase
VRYRRLDLRVRPGDRIEQAHKDNLYDIDARYGDVVSVEEVIEYLEEVAAAHAR